MIIHIIRIGYVGILEATPTLVSFAALTASSSVSNGNSASTGPNVSSDASRIAGVASVMIVGSKKYPPPRPVTRFPPVSTVAPCCLASSTWLATLSTPSGTVRGPIVVLLSSPWPTRMLRVWAASMDAKAA